MRKLMTKWGFTAVELMITLCVVAIISAVGTVTFVNMKEDASRAATLKNMLELKTIIRGNSDLNTAGSFNQPGFLTDMGRYPTSLDELVSNSASSMAVFDPYSKRGWRGPYVNAQATNWQKDAWGSNYSFDGTGLTMKSCGPDKICGGTSRDDILISVTAEGTAALSSLSSTSGVLTPINGGWSGWTSGTSIAGTCVTTDPRDCGTGTEQRIERRTCTNPEPKYGGAPCSGADNRIVSGSCSKATCPTDGGWTTSYGSWGNYGSCSLGCGGGTQEQRHYRTCTNPTPSINPPGAPCSGSDYESQFISCNSQDCWSAWSSWTPTTSCSSTCDGGTQSAYRTRTCQSIGTACTGGVAPGGTATETNLTYACNSGITCPTHGGWQSSASSVADADGIRVYLSKRCDNPQRSTNTSPPGNHCAIETSSGYFEFGSTDPKVERKLNSCTNSGDPSNNCAKAGGWSVASTVTIGNAVYASKTCNNPARSLTTSPAGANCSIESGYVSYSATDPIVERSTTISSCTNGATTASSCTSCTTGQAFNPSTGSCVACSGALTYNNQAISGSLGSNTTCSITVNGTVTFTGHLQLTAGTVTINGNLNGDGGGNAGGAGGAGGAGANSSSGASASYGSSGSNGASASSPAGIGGVGTTPTRGQTCSATGTNTCSGTAGGDGPSGAVGKHASAAGVQGGGGGGGAGGAGGGFGKNKAGCNSASSPSWNTTVAPGRGGGGGAGGNGGAAVTINAYTYAGSGTISVLGTALTGNGTVGTTGYPGAGGNGGLTSVVGTSVGGAGPSGLTCNVSSVSQSGGKGGNGGAGGRGGDGSIRIIYSTGTTPTTSVGSGFLGIN